VVRYAADFIGTARDQESLEKARIQMQPWRLERGLELSSEKTLITAMEDGFDFLGFNLRHDSSKLLIKPTQKQVLDCCRRIGDEIKGLNGASQTVVISKRNPILRGLANYDRTTVSPKTFRYISHRVGQYRWRWWKRRHPEKGKKWVRERYFQTIKGNRWTCACNHCDRSGKPKRIRLYPITSTAIERHIKYLWLREVSMTQTTFSTYTPRVTSKYIY
jgi:RNA-directed DNA polymerase